MNDGENGAGAAGRNNLAACTKQRLQGLAAQKDWPAYRAKQLFAWLQREGVDSFGEMTNLPAAMRNQLDEMYTIDAVRLAESQEDADGTTKMLLRLWDENSVEAVLMHYSHGYSVCISSQVGCRMGCAFCASTVAAPGFVPGLTRNLDAGEMARQVYAAREKAGQRVGHVVLMGIGEPLDNLDNVLDFVDIITDEDGYNLSQRAISLSTCGVVPGIEQLAQKKLGITLSVSLHAANNEVRNRLMPVNRRWPLEVLMEACRAYAAHTKRRISYEYALFAGVNDSEEDAAQTARLLRGQNAHLNLIAANPVPGSGLAPSGQKAVQAFAAQMTKHGVNTTVRRRLGAQIDAACGQLRRRQAQQE